MTPWHELTPLERREAIALRLGWQQLISDLDGEKLWLKVEGEYLKKWGIALPDWPTNDALAFTDVWPLLDAAAKKCMHNFYRTRLGRNALNYPTVLYELTDANSRSLHLGHVGTTWTDAICQAAYALIPVGTDGVVDEKS